jgi:hypothetical protein
VHLAQESQARLRGEIYFGEPGMKSIDGSHEV